MCFFAINLRFSVAQPPPGTNQPTSAPTYPPQNNYSCVGSDLVLGEGTVGNDFHFSGTALGGFLVLEPWITPSLFYQFLGATSKYDNYEK